MQEEEKKAEQTAPEGEAEASAVSQEDFKKLPFCQKLK